MAAGAGAATVGEGEGEDAGIKTQDARRKTQDEVGARRSHTPYLLYSKVPHRTGTATFSYLHACTPSLSCPSFCITSQQH